jgi:hypothetical protein
MLKRVKAALPATYRLSKFLYANRKVELAIGGTIVAGVEEIVRMIAVGHP